MHINKGVSKEEKLQAVKDYLNDKVSLSDISKKYHVSYSAIHKWICKYKGEGESAFEQSGHYKSYSVEFKHNVVQEYITGDSSYSELAVKYKIPSKGTIQRWVLKYNSHEELKSSGTGGNIIMTKGRKTTFDERIEIVEYCIAHNYNYSETAKKYQISYQQARNYTLKYKEGGVDALTDNRGKHKKDAEMNEVERLRAEIRILKAAKERAEMEASFLKKLKEIERRRG